MKFKEAREKAGFSQRKMAIEVGVSLVTIQNWDAGIGSPTPKNIKKIQKILGKIDYKKE